MRGLARTETGRRALLGAALVAAATLAGVAWAAQDDPLDPAHNTPLPCEAVNTPGGVPRSAKNIAHLANVCGFVGTDVEFQSRTAEDGVHDYAFVGTMGGGLRIFDVTDPAHPSLAGAYTDPGWQNDVQVRGDLAVIGFDPIGGINPSASLCLQAKGASGGVDLVRLRYDPATATFTTALLDCVSASPGGGAHNSTLHPSGDWLAMVNPRTHGSVDVVDLRTSPRRIYRIVQNGSLASSACAGAAAGQCISNGRPGTWSPHDVSFSRDGARMYVAAVGNDTVVVDVSRVLEGSAPWIGVVPNDRNRDGGVASDRHDVSISHQSDPSADEAILGITDERGGGLQETRCNTDPNGVIGGIHFWRLPVSGVADPAASRLGAWFYPNPTLALDPLQPVLASLPRTERACTIHVFRMGGNGTAGPGEIAPGYGGVSSLPARQLVTAHYGAGVWHLDFGGPSRSDDGIAEDPQSTWGNTLGWNVMPGAETWSAKEYKGFVYAGDMTRGFDVYRFARCEGLACVTPPPVSTPGKATGGGQLPAEPAELSILRGISAGGRASFGFNAQFAAGVLSGHLTFLDHSRGKKVESTAITSFTRAGNKATFTGLARVDGVAGVHFTVDVEDLGEPGTGDTFRLVLGDGYAAGGVLRSGNIQVHD
ncbi:MAG TPA: post-COAP-1 domain-containing protein [Gaiellaceae bacterium]|nr:post-COAP-1 domain-containing protein [Gaiellaceae bacterium]